MNCFIFLFKRRKKNGENNHKKMAFDDGHKLPNLSQQIKYKPLHQIKRYIACCNRETIRWYSIAIGIQSFISLAFNSTIKKSSEFGSGSWCLKIGIDENMINLPNSAGCYRWVSGCRFCCQNIRIVSLGVANNVTIL